MNQILVVKNFTVKNFTVKNFTTSSSLAWGPFFSPVVTFMLGVTFILRVTFILWVPVITPGKLAVARHSGGRRRPKLIRVFLDPIVATAVAFFFLDHTSAKVLIDFFGLERIVIIPGVLFLWITVFTG